jgi:hypothetical protein
MNTLTNEQVGLQIAKQTINNKLKKIWWLDISKTKLVEIKGAFCKQIISTKQSKYHQKHLRLPPSQVHTKKVKYIQRNVTTLQQHIKWLNVTNTNIYWIVVMVIQMHFFDKVEIMYQAI